MAINDFDGKRLNIFDLCFVCSNGSDGNSVAIKQDGKNHGFLNSFRCPWDNVMAYSCR